MFCECTVYTCLTFTSNCNAIITDLISDQTGIWTMRYEFNGRWFKQSINVTNGQNILLPHLFNEAYIHTLQFYNLAGDLFNDTCYTINTNNVDTAFPSTINNVFADLDSITYTFKSEPNPSNPNEQPEGNVITDDRIIGKDVVSAAGLSQSFTPDFFTKSGNTLIINTASFIDGNKLVVYVKNSIL